jgi:large subunit ribosomal protein L35
MEMPKMKTKSGAKKRFRVSPSGRVKARPAKMRHMQMNKPKSMKRRAKGQMILCEPNARSVIEDWMPYARVKKKPGTAKKAYVSKAKRQKESA